MSTKDASSPEKADSSVEIAASASEAKATHSAEGEELQQAEPMEHPIDVKVRTPRGMLVVKSIMASDPVAGLVELLGLCPLTCMYSHYHLELEDGPKAGRTKIKTTRLSLEDSLAGAGDLPSEPVLRMVLDKYTVRSAQDQVRRFRDVLKAPPSWQARVVPEGTSADVTGPAKEEDAGPVMVEAAMELAARREAREQARAEMEGLVSQMEQGITASKQRAAAAAAAAAAKDKDAEAATEGAEDKAETAVTEEERSEVRRKAASMALAKELALRYERSIMRSRRMAQAVSIRKDLEEIPSGGITSAVEAVPTPFDLGSDVPAPGTMATLDADDTDQAAPCVKSVVYSGWNPPPGPRTMVGDLFYLRIETLEGFEFHVTATPAGFFVNSTRGDSFNPAPSHNPCHAHTVAELLSQASSRFAKALAALLPPPTAARMREQQASDVHWDPTFSSSWTSPLVERTPYAAGTAGAAQFWLQPPSAVTSSRRARNVGEASDAAHRFDLNRAEDALMDTFGMDGRGKSRDWNEEIQCCRALPQDTNEASYHRSRAIFRVHSEFVDAALAGVIAILNGQIPALNPSDELDNQVYVYNSIFFSRGEDRKGSIREDPEASRKIGNLDLLGVRTLNAVDVDGISTVGTVIVDYRGQRLTAQTIVPGIMQGDRAAKLVYGSLDDGATIASEPETHALMGKVAEHLMLAESQVTPMGKAEGAEEDHAVSVEFARAEGQVPLYGAVDCKGVLGSDGRRYIMDFIRLAPRDPLFATGAAGRDAEAHRSAAVPPPSETDVNTRGLYHACFRPELLQHYARYLGMRAGEQEAGRIAKQRADAADEGAVATAEQKAADKTAAQAAVVEAAKAASKLAADVNVLTRYYSRGSGAEDGAAQGKETEEGEGEGEEKAGSDDPALALAEDLSKFLLRNVIPDVVMRAYQGATALTDGATLCEHLHASGINLRYLGAVATRATVLNDKHGPRNNLVELCEVEMIARSVAHILRKILSANEDISAAPGPTFALLLNLLLGARTGSATPPSLAQQRHVAKTSASAASSSAAGAGSKKRRAKSVIPQASVLQSTESAAERAARKALPPTHAAMWTLVRAEVEKRFRYTLKQWDVVPATAQGGEQQSAERETYSASALPLPLLRRVAQRAGIRLLARDLDFSSSSPLNTSDVLGVVPLVKHSGPAVPVPEASSLTETASRLMQEDQIDHAVDCAREAYSLLFQGCGVAHKSVATASHVLATATAQQISPAEALPHMWRSLVIYERCCGPDHSDTLHAHARLGSLLHAAGHHARALAHVRHAINLALVAGGPRGTVLIDLVSEHARILEDCGRWEAAAAAHQWMFDNSPLSNLAVARVSASLAQVLASGGQLRPARDYQSQALKLAETHLGPQNERTQMYHSRLAGLTKLTVAIMQQQHAMVQAQAAPAKKADKASTTAKSDKPAASDNWAAPSAPSTGGKKQKKKKNRKSK